MTVGQEFAAWAATLAEEEARILDSRALLREINLGATAIGTGITAEPAYRECRLPPSAEITGLPVVGAVNLVEATSDTGVFVQLSGVLKRTAVKVSKICNDLRLLSSGPQAASASCGCRPARPGPASCPARSTR